MVRAPLTAVAIVLTGCSARTMAPLPPAAHSSSSYIDLQPGWRLRVVTPLLKSGGYWLQSKEQLVDSTTVTLSVGDDFVGYERAYYAVKPKNGGGVRIEFSSAEAVKGEEKSPQPRPIAPLFDVPRSTKYVRLVYLQRVSQADHEMAVVAASRVDTLEKLTEQVGDNPTVFCRRGRRADCAWIPAGISVQPEMQTSGGGTKWVPAR